MVFLILKPYHVMSNGLKMTGATHSGSDSIIYDTMEESLGQPAVISQTSNYSTPDPYRSHRDSTPVDTTPNIVIEQTTPTTTTNTTPTTTTNTTTTTDTSTTSDSSDPTPPSSGGGYGGGY